MRDHENEGLCVLDVFASASHHFSKVRQDGITLLQGLGIDGDAHCGAQVKHRFDARKDPTRPNLRQVHLLQSELLDELHGKGFAVRPGDLGENILTRGLDLLSLPAGTRLHLGEAIVQITGLRNPCIQIERFRAGLLDVVLEKRQGAAPIRKMGVMSVVVQGGKVRAGDAIEIHLPIGEHVPLAVV